MQVCSEHDVAIQAFVPNTATQWPQTSSASIRCALPAAAAQQAQSLRLLCEELTLVLTVLLAGIASLAPPVTRCHRHRPSGPLTSCRDCLPIRVAVLQGSWSWCQQRVLHPRLAPLPDLDGHCGGDTRELQEAAAAGQCGDLCGRHCRDVHAGRSRCHVLRDGVI